MTSNNNTSSGWTEHSKYVLNELKRLNEVTESIRSRQESNYIELLDRINEVNKNISSLNNKVSKNEIKINSKTIAVSALSGFIPALIVVIYLFLNHLK